MCLLLSFCLKPSIMETGKVWPFSQMSTSFLILSCKREELGKSLSPHGTLRAGRRDHEQLRASSLWRCAPPCVLGRLPQTGCDRQQWIIQERAWTYLLVFGRRRDDVVHQDGHEFRHSVDASGEGAIWRGAADGLALLLRLLQPFAGYRVYNVEHAELVGARSFLEVGENPLDED